MELCTTSRERKDERRRYVQEKRKREKMRRVCQLELEALSNRDVTLLPNPGERLLQAPVCTLIFLAESNGAVNRGYGFHTMNSGMYPGLGQLWERTGEVVVDVKKEKW